MEQNEMNNENQAGEPTPQPPQDGGADQGGESVAEEKKAMGPLVGIIIIVVVIVLGGYYFWTTQLNQEPMTAEEIAAEEDTATNALNEQSDSDEVADIEADLDATDLEGLDAELEQIDQELAI